MGCGVPSRDETNPSTQPKEPDCERPALHRQIRSRPRLDLFKRTVAKANELGVDVVHVKPEDLIMTRAQARDRETYLKARKMAEAIGQTVQVVDNPTDDGTQRQVIQATHHLTDDALYIRAGAVDPRTYQRLTTQARAEMKRIVPVSTWDDAPEDIRAALTA